MLEAIDIHEFDHGFRVVEFVFVPGSAIRTRRVKRPLSKPQVAANLVEIGIHASQRAQAHEPCSSIWVHRIPISQNAQLSVRLRLGMVRPGKKSCDGKIFQPPLNEDVRYLVLDLRMKRFEIGFGDAAIRLLLFFANTDQHVPLIVGLLLVELNNDYICASGVVLSRFSAAPSARLGHFPFESDGTFPAQC